MLSVISCEIHVSDLIYRSLAVRQESEQVLRNLSRRNGRLWGRYQATLERHYGQQRVPASTTNRRRETVTTLTGATRACARLLFATAMATSA